LSPHRTPPASSPLFPYTTLFRSAGHGVVQPQGSPGLFPHAAVGRPHAVLALEVDHRPVGLGSVDPVDPAVVVAPLLEPPLERAHGLPRRTPPEYRHTLRLRPVCLKPGGAQRRRQHQRCGHRQGHRDPSSHPASLRWNPKLTCAALPILPRGGRAYAPWESPALTNPPRLS